MKLHLSLGVLTFLFLFIACESDPQKVAPESRGQRGESCQARNDCASGLACISGVCSRNDFEVEVSARQCDVVECETQADCCGNRPTEAPAECARRASTCTMPSLPGCQATPCASDATCGAGTCRPGVCSNNTIIACDAASDCADTCVGGLCSISGSVCTTDTSCFGGGSCLNRTCSCANPEYDPADPVCTNPDCVTLCELVCEEERCVPDTSCQSDVDCSLVGARICSAGRCVECELDGDCDIADGEGCVAGECKKPCTQNEECLLFHQCQDGECIETGCSSDRECVLAASRGDGTDDARLSLCLPSDEDPALKVCKVPCENDGECGSEFQVCEAGFCKFVGCDNDEECRAFLGLQEVQETETRPFISKAVCRE